MLRLFQNIDQYESCVIFFDNLVKKLNFISERVPKNIWPNIYWFQHENNYLYHPGCANRQFLQKREFCGDPRYLNGICTGMFVLFTF